ncbi:GNAT family N-acetyltransferase [Paenibacillus sp. UNC451MF]|uniref:GNAT family N-acetyltransferase n=1 Tax=Paenibacillus sp. UNC451MF TaxID=1449063 RepID=UPI0005654349|nr:GNAT family N-acetyltransferase [Paenibacillus sp. UNC451MF]
MKQPVTIKNDQINGKFTMSQARPEDTEAIMALLLEIAEWLRSKGSSQWKGLLEGYDSHDTANAIQRGDVFICKFEEDVAGSVMLIQKPSDWDCNLWGSKAHREDQAIYLHRLAVKRKYANTGLGKAILQWCDSGIRFEGKTVVRLDCIASSLQLNNFYSHNGYFYMGEKDGFSIYEKSIALNE